MNNTSTEDTDHGVPDEANNSGTEFDNDNNDKDKSDILNKAVEYNKNSFEKGFTAIPEIEVNNDVSKNDCNYEPTSNVVETNVLVKELINVATETKSEASECTLFIEHFVDFIQRNCKSATADNIAEAVSSAINSLLQGVAAKNSKFKVCEVLKVGSFQEGTKVFEPDEFDFLAVVEELSRPGAIDVSMKDIRPGFAEVILIDQDLKERWGHSQENSVLHNFQEVEYSQSFGYTALSVIKDMADFQKLEYEIHEELGYISFNRKPLEFPCKNEIVLFLTYAEIWNPNMNLIFDFGDMSISVDLSPAIRYHNVADCFKPEDCLSEELANAVISRKSILLVNQNTWDKFEQDPNHIHLFRITFTETELLYMQNMNANHKKLYIFLKGFSKTYHKTRLASETTDIYGFSTPSYHLKLLCIDHNETCKKVISTDICLYQILAALFRYVEIEEVKSVFNQKLSIRRNPPQINSNKMVAVLIDLCTDPGKFVQNKNFTSDFDPIPGLQEIFMEAFKTKQPPNLSEMKRKLVQPMLQVIDVLGPAFTKLLFKN